MAYSTVELAGKLGIGRQTLIRWVRTGKIRAPKLIRIGNVKVRLWGPHDVQRVNKYKNAHYRKGRGRKKVVLTEAKLVPTLTPRELGKRSAELGRVILRVIEKHPGILEDDLVASASANSGATHEAVQDTMWRLGKKGRLCRDGLFFYPVVRLDRKAKKRPGGGESRSAREDSA